MIRGQRHSRFSKALFLAAGIALAPGCTLFSDAFLPEQPVAEVTVQGTLYVDRATGGQEGCSAGRTLFWGTARNTGDIDVDDVFIEIDALDAGGRVLGTYRVNVFNGSTSGGTEENPIIVAGTSLAVDQSGTFEVCAPLAYGSVASTAYRTDFIVVSEIQ